MMRPSYIALVILLLVPVVSSEYEHFRSRRQHRCKVENLRFQRHVDLNRYVGRFIYQKVTPVFEFFPDLQQGRTIAKLASEDTFTTYAIGRDPNGKCVKNLFACRLVNPPGPALRITAISFEGVPTMPDIQVAETDYVGYFVFYICLEKARDGTCAKHWTIVESRNEEMTRRQKAAVSRVLRRLCVDESTLINMRQGPRCPEPENFRFNPISQPIADFL